MTQCELQNFLGNAAALPRTTTLFRETGIRTLLLHLKAGERIPEHQTRGAILVHCVTGQGAFFADDRVELRPGILISVPPESPHSVVAAEDGDLLLLVTVSEQAVNG
jgi:quercetin dioxygenase-like cupin family protein